MYCSWVPRPHKMAAILKRAPRPHMRANIANPFGAGRDNCRYHGQVAVFVQRAGARTAKARYHTEHKS